MVDTQGIERLSNKEVDVLTRQFRTHVGMLRILREEDPDFLDREHELRQKAIGSLAACGLNYDPLHHAECGGVGRYVLSYYFAILTHAHGRGIQV